MDSLGDPVYLEELAAACSGSGSGSGGTTTGLGVTGLDGSRGSVTAGAMTLQPLGSLVNPEHHHHTGHHHGTTTTSAGDHRVLTTGRIGSFHSGGTTGLHGGGHHTSPPPSQSSAPAPPHLRPHHTTTAHSPVKLEAQHTRIGEYRITLLVQTLVQIVGSVTLGALRHRLLTTTFSSSQLLNFLSSNKSGCLNTRGFKAVNK